MSNMLSTWFRGSLKEMVDMENINEIMINGPHDVFIETNGVITRFDDTKNEFTLQYLREISRLVATNTKQDISELSPILSATLHTGERIQIVCPPACDFSQYAIAIRKPSASKYTLDSYSKMGFFDLVNHVSYKHTQSEIDDKLAYYEKKQDWIKFLKLCVSGKKNIVVSGGTGSGKTTFTNCLISYITELERLITIEDAREVLTSEEDAKRNKVNLLTSPKAPNKEAVTFSDLVKACLRLRPDRIMLSELRGTEAFDFLNGINTGHNGSITSIHANTASSVYDRMVTMIKMSESGRGMSKSDIYDYCRNSIDLIIQCDKSNGKWHMKEIIRRA